MAAYAATGDGGSIRRDALRRIAFIRVAQGMVLSLDVIAGALAGLPEGRTSDRRDWEQIAGQWRCCSISVSTPCNR